jgi:hypothetical protein
MLWSEDFLRVHWSPYVVTSRSWGLDSSLYKYNVKKCSSFPFATMTSYRFFLVLLSRVKETLYSDVCTLACKRRVINDVVNIRKEEEKVESESSRAQWPMCNSLYPLDTAEMGVGLSYLTHLYIQYKPTFLEPKRGRTSVVGTPLLSARRESS